MAKIRTLLATLPDDEIAVYEDEIDIHLNLIHVVLDNFGIHYSHETRRALRGLGRIRLHFLPPYSPEHDVIERFWQDLHANVTRNHKHAELTSLCGTVAEYLDGASPWLPKGS